jgi:hypothetical protein
MAKKKKTNAQILKKTKALLEKKETELAAAEKQAEELAAQKVTTVAAQKTAAEDLELREAEQRQARADQLKAQREARDLAERLGAEVDTATGIIDPETVTTPFNIYGPKGGKTVDRTFFEGEGANRVQVTVYMDGTRSTTPAPLTVGSGSGNTGGGNTGGGNNSDSTAAAAALLAFNKSQAAAELQAKRESAFGILKKEFSKYGLGSLVDSVRNLILAGSSPEETILTLRGTPEYLKRFAGNKLRLDAGLNVYDEATYIDLENAYDQIFTSYGVEEAAGNTREARQAKYAEFIGGTKSPDEIKGRVQLAVLASQEDAVTKATLRELYPMLGDKDLVSYFLNPKETLPKLETKIRSAQVGAAAVRQGLVTNVATAEELVGLGVTEEEAERAYSAYAYDKPRIDLLSGLDSTKDNVVNQQVAEGALLKNLASEQRKIELLKQKESARFGGTSGTARDISLSKQMGGTY